MLVVIVFSLISWRIFNHGGKNAKSADMHKYPEKCHSDEARSEMTLVERGKPCERVTQNLVGASQLRKMNQKLDYIM